VTARSSSVQVGSIIPGVESFVETAEEPGDKDGSTGDDDMMSGDDVGNHEHHKEGNGASDNVTDMDFSRGSNASGSQRADFPPATFESMANHILDKVTGQLFDELVDKVLAEDDVPLAVVTPEAFVTPATSALVMAEVGVADDTGRCTQRRTQSFNLGGAWFFLLHISTHFFTFFSIFLSYFSFDFNGGFGQ